MDTGSKLGRRPLLGILAGLPTSAWLSVKGALYASPASDQECKARLAVQVMRFVNTAEKWHKVDFGRHVGIGGLAKSPVLEQMRGSERLEKAGLGKTLLAKISLDGAEVVPGWKLRVRSTGDPPRNRLAEMAGKEATIAPPQLVATTRFLCRGFLVVGS